MLTPYGLIKNIVLQNSYLYPYYFKEVQNPENHSFPVVGFFIVMQITLSFILLGRLARKGTEK